VWEDERSSFTYCEVQEVPLSNQYKNENLKLGPEGYNPTAVKFVRSGTVDFFPEEIFANFPSTIGFILESSEIPVLTDSYFTAKFSPLKFIEIQHNNLEHINKNALQSLTNLEWVRLASNKIESLNGMIFWNNRQLKYVDFRNNKLNSIVPGFFRGLNRLTQVLLGENECVNEDFQKSDGTFDKLTNSLKTCFGNAPDEELECTFHYWFDERPGFHYCIVDEFPLTNENKYKDLTFSGANQQKNEASALKFYHSSDVVFFPESSLTEFPQLIGLILEDSNLPIIKERLIGRKFKNLKFLEIQKSNVEKIHLNALQYLTNLEWVRLASNKIEGIDGPIFRNNKQLKYVDFRSNRIKRLHPELFAGLSNLDQALFTTGNVCINKDYIKADGSFDRLSRDLKPCQENCERSGECSATSTIDKFTCGQQVVGSSLINHGKKFPRGKWPWMGAFYWLDKFTCGGNLSEFFKFSNLTFL
jgi:Leucine-rich repeat (LRR) protein